MTIGKILIVGVTALIVNLVLQANGFSFTVQILTSLALGLSFGIVDAASSDE